MNVVIHGFRILKKILLLSCPDEYNDSARQTVFVPRSYVFRIFGGGDLCNLPISSIYRMSIWFLRSKIRIRSRLGDGLYRQPRYYTCARLRGKKRKTF